MENIADGTYTRYLEQSNSQSESTLVDAKDLGGGRGNGELEFNGDRVLVQESKKV